jgi:proline racemase/trans-L-3-hydroxyproline dehydratase
MLTVETVDYHTAGEPFRIVTAGAPAIDGSSAAERRVRATATEEVDRLRRLLCHEPRGHADMYGCFLVPPDDAGADLGALFWHKDGFSTACGHGTIALGAWAVDSGKVSAPEDGEVDVTIDVPSGRVIARVRCRAGQVEEVGFLNVPSFVIAREVSLAGAGVDVAFGGAIYGFVHAEALGLSVAADRLTELIAAGRSLKASLETNPASRHPSDERLSGVYGVVIYEEPRPGRRRSVTIFADGEVDRSPTGSACSALVALLADEGALRRNEEVWVESLIGTEFRARHCGDAEAGVLTEVSGTAFLTGEHRFVLDPRDPLGVGFVLR